MRKTLDWVSVCSVVALIGISGVTLASENVPGTILGKGISLFERGHAFSGSIAETPVFGIFEEGSFSASVQIRRNGKTSMLRLLKNGKAYSGELTEPVEDGAKELQTHIELEGVKKTGPTEGLLLLKVDGESLPVKVSAKTFEQGHFQAPHFETTYHGNLISFDFSGQSCFGYSANIAMMVLAPYVHLSK